MSSFNRDKKTILDVLVKVNDEFIVDLEMQTSSLTTSIRQRFQVYASRMLLTQIPKGEDYGHVKPVYQIIFIHDIDKRCPHTLISRYRNYDDEGNKEIGGLMPRVYVYLPVINDIVKIKDELDELETALDVFKNDLQCVKSNQKVVDKMEKKHETLKKEVLLV